VKLSGDLQSWALLLAALKDAQDAASCNTLLTACSSGSSAALALDLLQVMASNQLQLLPGACTGLLLGTIKVPL
jgi:hypothetical protein